jgi:hypothetical protein
VHEVVEEPALTGDFSPQDIPQSGIEKIMNKDRARRTYSCLPVWKTFLRLLIIKKVLDELVHPRKSKSTFLLSKKM